MSRGTPPVTGCSARSTSGRSARSCRRVSLQVSGQVVLVIRVWSSAMQKPLDDIDPEILSAACSLMGAFAGGFTLGGTVRDIDLMAMSAQPAYVDFEGKPFRVVEISLPIVINDMFAESA